MGGWERPRSGPVETEMVPERFRCRIAEERIKILQIILAGVASRILLLLCLDYVRRENTISAKTRLFTMDSAYIELAIRKRNRRNLPVLL